MAFPDIDPVLLQLGPFAIRWYALAYIAGLLVGWQYMQQLNRARAKLTEAAVIDDLLVWAIVGVVLGGRLGYVLFYNLPYYSDNPLQALAVWQGGMSFHGGLLGVMAALIWFARRRRIGLLRLADLTACAVPIGLLLGRIANFINGELYGRVTDLPWGVVFPGGGPLPRHPSQLYEAVLEGALLFAVLAWLAWRGGAFARPGLLTGVYLCGYALARGLAELARQPDLQIGFLAGGSTMGQWLSLPMLLGGLYLIWRARGATADPGP
ncbi:MAG: prolipoprotein diacylglyceryl transferase [Alphaproteobacteria bacterium]|nr:prolipoprotein diacylglyceryl transferase [Alphaproteobacteria bacterium]MDP6814777.1 prolipoprotein diacylglyceryl transferase [Alphaproteobacteria bacterium]